MIKTRACSRCNGTGKEIDQQALAKQMRLKRFTSGKSLRSVALQMGITAAYLSDMEHGRRAWRAERIAQFEKAIK